MADQVRYAGTPRWVKLSAIIAGALVLVVVILMLVGGGSHGPGLHMTAAEVKGSSQASAP